MDEVEVRERVTRWLDDQVKRIEAEGGNVTQGHLRLGRPDEGIITVAEEIGSLAEEIGAVLIVIGGRGLGGIRRGKSYHRQSMVPNTVVAVAVLNKTV
jgi:nucleotide-binding universal stress UspA family protein